MMLEHIDDYCLAIVSKNGQVSVLDDLINKEDLDNKSTLELKFNNLCKKNKSFSKKFKVVKAVLFIEEK